MAWSLIGYIHSRYLFKFVGRSRNYFQTSYGKEIPAFRWDALRRL